MTQIKPLDPESKEAKNILAKVYDVEKSRIPLPKHPPQKVKFVVIQEEETFSACGLNVDIASCGDSPEEAASNFEEALRLYYDTLPAKKHHKLRSIYLGETRLNAPTV